MKVLKKENKVYAYHTKDVIGDYVLNDERYTVNTAKEIYAPDTADLSMWVEVDSKERYVSEFMADYAYVPQLEDHKHNQP